MSFFHICITNANSSNYFLYLLAKLNCICNFISEIFHNHEKLAVSIFNHIMKV